MLPFIIFAQNIKDKKIILNNALFITKFSFWTSLFFLRPSMFNGVFHINADRWSYSHGDFSIVHVLFVQFMKEKKKLYVLSFSQFWMQRKKPLQHYVVLDSFTDVITISVTINYKNELLWHKTVFRVLFKRSASFTSSICTNAGWWSYFFSISLRRTICSTEYFL